MLACLPQEPSELVRGVLPAWLHDVLVALGHLRVGPAHHVLSDAVESSRLENERRGRVPRVVQAGVAYVRGLE